MTAFAACIFALAALASALTIAATLRRHGADALALRARLAECPETLVLTWKVMERVPLPTLAALRKRPARRIPARLEWPGATIDLAA
ncbi:hypothetical protein [Novosphingobium resinovorum]|uniref:hypothetical protein n=1 Tax=Novosphingobium resinovorum TaxID=158500 RepID=UPI002ED00BA5|nr:hypothetical protein [Novosphingobium resinovorum]